MNRKVILWILAVACVLSACNQTDDNEAQNKIVVKTTKAAAVSSAISETYAFIVRPWRTSELSFRVSGSIDRLEVYAGNRYKRGDLVAEDLRAVIEALNSILGKSITSQDTLNNIFRNFCIGK